MIDDLINSLRIEYKLRDIDLPKANLSRLLSQFSSYIPDDILLDDRINWQTENALCDSCNIDLEVPQGYIGIPKGYSTPYLLCEECWQRGWYEHDTDLARKRALIWWLTGDDTILGDIT